MDQVELCQELESLGFPVAYGSFKSTVEPPFITFQFSYSDDLIADNHNYADVENYQIELYTKHKHPPTEKLIQDKLKELKLPYSKVESYLPSDDLRQVIYEIQLIGG